MRFSAIAAIAASIVPVPVCGSTGSLVPLYVYPSVVYNDNAANWQPTIKAIKKSPNTSWLVVINPDSGPGGKTDPGNGDINFISGVSQLNALPNVKNIGYVHTNYAKADKELVKANITKFSTWSKYQDKDISVKGIFFDESAEDAAYLRDVTSFAKNAFKGNVTTVCNFGTKTADEYYDICDIVIAFESCLNCSLGPQYKSAATIAANIPTNRVAKAAILVNTFSGTSYDGKKADAALLNDYIHTQKGKGLGWTYFTAAGYNNTSIIGDLADALARA